MHETLKEAATSGVEYRETRDLPRDGVLVLYGACLWSAAEKPDQLMSALTGSNAVVSAWHNGRLVGLGNAITDGALVVYYPHLLVHPDYRGRGIGGEIMRRLMEPYASYHQHAILADDASSTFYRKLGFTRPAKVTAMWVYSATDHGPTEHWGSRMERLFWQVLRWGEHKTRQKVAMVAVVAQILLAVIVAIAFMVDAESILVTWLALPAVGYVTSLVAWPLSSPRMLALGLSAPLASILGGLLVLTLQPYAVGLILALMVVYLLFAVLAGRRVLEEILHWSPNAAAKSNPVQQFSLRSIFVVTTSVALSLAAQRLLVQLAGHDAGILYICTYVLTNIVLSGIIVACFVVKQRRS